jgi:AbrB family looped-hinge helix DNA binding protein
LTDRPGDGIISKKNKKRRRSSVKKSGSDRFIVSVKVGPKGQITLPVEARNMFGIETGDTVMVMGDRRRGLALLKADAFYAMMDGAGAGAGPSGPGMAAEHGPRSEDGGEKDE